MSNSAHMQWEKEALLDDLINEREITLGRGNIISKIDIRNNPGPHPIYSSSAKNNGKMGEYGDFMFDEELISWSVDGGGNFFYRPKHKFSVTNVSGYLRVNCGGRWHYRFLHYSLDYQHGHISFDYQSKAHPSVIRDIYSFPIIPLPEQKKIASILTSVDDVIEKTESQIAKLQDLKTGMMQELLTEGIGHTEFKDSPVGRIPVGWDFITLKSKVSLVPGYAFKSTDFVESGVPLIRMGNLYQNKLDLNRNPIRLPASFIDKHEKFTVHQNDIVLSMTGTGGKEDYGFAVQVPVGHPVCMLNQRVAKVIPNDGVDKDFLLALLHSRLFLDEIYAAGAGTKQANLSSANILGVEVPFPSSEEQQRIAKAFVAMDNNITAKSNLLFRSRELKKALMQDLLTGKVRVKTD